jgi:hypothetical protein
MRLHLQHGELATETPKDGKNTLQDGHAFVATLPPWFRSAGFWNTCFWSTSFWSVASR